MSSPTSPSTKSASYLPSPFAALKKASNLIGHYVDLSDSSSVLSSSSIEPEPSDVVTETSEKNDLQVPLLATERTHSAPNPASDGPDTPSQSIANSPSGSPASNAEPSPVATLKTPDIELRAASSSRQSSGEATPESSDSADDVEMDSDPQQLPRQSSAEAATTSDSSDGAQTPTQQDIRASRLQSQPAPEEVVPAAVISHGSQAHPGDLDRLGSDILDPSLLAPLLSNEPLPELSHQGEMYVPHEPAAHLSGE